MKINFCWENWGFPPDYLNLIGYLLRLSLVYSILYRQRKFPEKWRNYKQNGDSFNCFKSWKWNNLAYNFNLNTIKGLIEVWNIADKFTDAEKQSISELYGNQEFAKKSSNRATRAFWWFQISIFCTLKFEAEIWE